MQNDTGLGIESSCWTDAITEAIHLMFHSDGCDQTEADTFHLVVDVSRLLPKIEQISEALYSSRITTDQLNRLIQSVYILPARKQKKDCLMLYADMEPPLDIIQLH